MSSYSLVNFKKLIMTKPLIQESNIRVWQIVMYLKSWFSLFLLFILKNALLHFNENNIDLIAESIK